jgi:predicted transcriptional regulator
VYVESTLSLGGVIECRRCTRQCGIEIGGISVRVRGFGELEAVVMDRIWNQDGTTTVREIFDELAAEREIAYTTVMSTMDNLHTKGWLARERDGKAYRYWPTLTREQHSAQLMREALDGGGRSELVLSHFLEQISPEESARLRDALQRLARRARRK